MLSVSATARACPARCRRVGQRSGQRCGDSRCAAPIHRRSAGAPGRERRRSPTVRHAPGACPVRDGGAGPWQRSRTPATKRPRGVVVSAVERVPPHADPLPRTTIGRRSSGSGRAGPLGAADRDARRPGRCAPAACAPRGRSVGRDRRDRTGAATARRSTATVGTGPGNGNAPDGHGGASRVLQARLAGAVQSTASGVAAPARVDGRPRYSRCRACNANANDYYSRQSQPDG